MQNDTTQPEPVSIPGGVHSVARPRLLEPGLRRLEPGIEHYRVRGGGSTTQPVTQVGDKRLGRVDGTGMRNVAVQPRFGQGLPILAPILLAVHQYQIRFQLANAVELGILGPADLFQRSDFRGGVDAEFGHGQ